MGSWLDTKKFMTSLAKTAMAEAQKTLDKALDVENEDPTTNIANSNFDQWGSFTGSFFPMPDSSSNSGESQNQVTKSQSEPVSIQPTISQKPPDLLLQPQPVITENVCSTSLMQECEEEELAQQLQSTDELATSMSSSRTTVASTSRLSESNQFQTTEALVEDALKESEASSSSKSFEMLKMESLPTSGHTSGDDVEVITNTSSDIEIISSPVMSENGRKRCQQILQSKVNNPHNIDRVKKEDDESFPDYNLRELFEGHLRTSSEVSTCPSEDNSEAERLVKKLSEMSEILEARESKLVELSRSNLELQEKTTDLTSQVKEAMKINNKLQEASISSDEFTNRLSKMETKLQQTIAERDKLRSENKTMKEDLAKKMTDAEIEEKDEIIEALRAEGESLSKQAGKHSEAIKKLRAKEKANEKEIKHLKEKLDDKSKECDRLAKSLEAKNEVESKQIEAIQGLTKANKDWEESSKKVASDLEDANEKVSGLKLSLEGAYKEMAELRRGLTEKEDEAQELALNRETLAKEKLQEQLRESQEKARLESDKMLRQIDELREALAASERNSVRIEDRLQREREDLLKKLQESESRHEELSGSLSSSTRPLLRQIESLQSSLAEAQSNSDRAEKSLSDRLQQATVQLSAAQERERNAAEQYRQLSAKSAALEAKMSTLNKNKTLLETQAENQSKDFENLTRELCQFKSLNESVKSSLGKEIQGLKEQCEKLRKQAGLLQQDLESEKRKNVALIDQLKDRDRRIKEMSVEQEQARSFRGKSSSPAFSSQHSISSEQAWPEEVFETRSGYEKFLVNGLPSMGSSSALLESLQSQLKQKEGENVQLQMELVRLEKTRSSLTSELAKLSEETEKMHRLSDDHDDLQKMYRETEEKYQTMLTMYGEKVEEAEELRLDLEDVKEMYKMQLEELLRKQSSV